MAYSVVKRLLDVLVASILLLATFPLWLLIAAALFCTQGRPIIYRQRRVGLYGAPFTLLKFRTITDDPPREIHDRPVGKLSDHARITPLGQFLRRSSLDELPQFLNILRGEMSCVGPRPLPQDDLDDPIWLAQVSEEERARRAAWVTRRHQVLPGLTGRWQISAAPEEDLGNWMRCDLEYVTHHPLREDARIFLQTPFAVLRGRRQNR